MSTLNLRWPALLRFLWNGAVAANAQAVVANDCCSETANAQRQPLLNGEVCSVEAREVDKICVARGTVWVTQNHDTTDYVLNEGDALIPGRRGRIVIQAMSPAAVLTLSMRQPSTQGRQGS